MRFFLGHCLFALMLFIFFSIELSLFDYRLPIIQALLDAITITPFVALINGVTVLSRKRRREKQTNTSHATKDEKQAC